MELRMGDNSPWGEIDDIDELIEETVYRVGTPSHGGIMVYANSDIGKAMSNEAWRIACCEGRWLCFEEDMDYIIAYRELARLGYIEQLPYDYQEAIENSPNSYFGEADCLTQYYPEYVAAFGLEA